MPRAARHGARAVHARHRGRVELDSLDDEARHRGVAARAARVAAAPRRDRGAEDADPPVRGARHRLAVGSRGRRARGDARPHLGQRAADGRAALRRDAGAAAADLHRGSRARDSRAERPRLALARLDLPGRRDGGPRVRAPRVRDLGVLPAERRAGAGGSRRPQPPHRRLRVAARRDTAVAPGVRARPDGRTQDA